VQPPAPAAAAPAGGQAWLIALRSKLAACEQMSFFERVACREKARWSHCAPDHWNTVAECKVGAGQQQ
jgi:hypothetical protein